MNKTNKQKGLLSNPNGQAVFELIIFLPFLIFLYTIYYTTGNSINGSINQQKAVRGYFYALSRGNSYIAPLVELEGHSAMGIGTVGFSAVGWREKAGSGGGGGETAYAPCFKFSSVLKNDTQEECDDKERESEGSTRYIRVFTFYGVCGPVYSKTSSGGGEFFEINPSMQNHPYSCALGGAQ